MARESGFFAGGQGRFSFGGSKYPVEVFTSTSTHKVNSDTQMFFIGKCCSFYLAHGPSTWESPVWQWHFGPAHKVYLLAALCFIVPFSKANNYLENKSDEPTNPHMSYWNLRRKFCLQNTCTRTQPVFNIWVSPSSIKWLRNVWNVSRLSEKFLSQYFSDRKVGETEMFFFHSYAHSVNTRWSLSSICSTQLKTMKTWVPALKDFNLVKDRKHMRVATTQRDKLIREMKTSPWG